jgi:hypothetical protein
MIKKEAKIMNKTRFNGLRILVIIILAILILQYVLGMVANLAGPPELPPVSALSSQFGDALNQAGIVETVHATIGSLLPVFGILILILSLRSRVWSVQLIGTLAFLALLVAAISGVLFVQSGFQNDTFSQWMAVSFILSLIFYFLELYFLKPAPKTQTG